MDTWGENLVFIRWFYVENCKYVQITDIIFLVTGPSPFGTHGPPLPLSKVVLEQPMLAWRAILASAELLVTTSGRQITLHYLSFSDIP